MKLTRRRAIKNIMIVTVGAGMLPACLQQDDKASLPLKNIRVSGSDEKLLAEIEETIIPATGTPGAKDLSIHLFTLKMIDDCYEKEKQEQFVKGLREINAICKKKFNTTFMECTVPQREEVLTAIEDKNLISSDASAFYALAKSLTIQGYMNSKYVMTNLVKYELVPGRFSGSYPISQKKLTA